jgi:serine/threonine protein kinase
MWSLGCTVLEMATGRPPWSHVSSPLAALYRLGCTEELPELPASLSLQIRDFLEKCFRRDPKKRWSSAELLNHPFLNEHCSAIEAEKAIRGLESPTSHLDFRNKVWDSYYSQTTPILSLSIQSPNGKCNGEVNRSVEQCPRPSPRDRMMALAAGCKFEDVANRPNWITNPHGQWIVVKSSGGNSLTSGKPLSKSDISSGSSIKELPFTKAKCSSSLEDSQKQSVVPAWKLSIGKSCNPDVN